MTNLQAWSFLVSRTYYIDYGPIVIPDFMYEVKKYRLLAEAAEGDLTEVGTALYREIHNSDLGALTIVYRVIEVTPETTGIDSFIEDNGNKKKCINEDGILQDCFGRKISLIEGIVFNERIPNIKVTQENFENVHQQIMESYRQHWDSDIERPIVPSKPFTLQVGEGDCLKYIKLNEYFVGSKQQKSKEPNEHTSKKLWKIKSTIPVNSEVTSVAFFPDGNSLAIRCDEANQRVLILDLDGQLFKSFRGEKLYFAGSHTPVTISPNGQYIASAMIQSLDQNVVKVWERETWKQQEFTGHAFSNQGRIRAVVFTPDSEALISAGYDKVIFIWDIKVGGELSRLEGDIRGIEAIAISPDGKILASGHRDGTIVIWNLRTREIDRAIKNMGETILPIRSLAFSPDGQLLASGGDDYTIKLWNPKKGKENCTLGQHSAAINSIAFSPDGKLLASGSDDCRIKIWEIQSKKAIAVLGEHRKEVNSVAFSPDGKLLASGSKDRTVKIWQFS